MKFKVTEQEFKTYVTGVLSSYFGVKPEDASKAQIYRATCMVVRDLLTNKRVDFKKVCHEKNAKQVYYMSMEFCLADLCATTFQYGHHRAGDQGGGKFRR